MPTAMQETYQSCDKPPPLSLLNKFRDDDKDSLKFYTDPNYFFELWREEVLKDTERAKQGKKPHKPRNAQSTDGSRQKKRVRQPVKTIDRHRDIAVGHGEYLIPTEQPRALQPAPQQQQPPMHPQAMQPAQAMHMNQMHYRSPMQMQEDMHNMLERPNRPNSIEIRRSYQQEMPDGVHSPMYMPYEDQNQYQPGMYGGHAQLNEQHYQPGTPTRKIRPTQPPPAPPSNQSTPSANTPTRGRSMSAGRDNLPPPPPPPEAMMSPPNGIPAHLIRQTSGSRSNSPHSHQGTPEPDQDLPPPPPVPKQASPPKQATPVQAPPPPPPPPMPLLANGPASPPPLPITNGDLAKILNSAPPKLTPPKERAIQKAPPMVDPRNDLLKAIRDGIKLRKVEKIEQKEVERGNGLHDVASILARRVAVEFSDSDSASDSDCDSEGWGENETSA